MKKLLYMFTALILSVILAACAAGSADIWPEGFKEGGKIDSLSNYYAYLAKNVFSPQLDFIIENGTISAADDSYQSRIDKLINESAQIYKDALDKVKNMDVADGLKSVHSVLIEYMETKATAYETMRVMYKEGLLEFPRNDDNDVVNEANASQIATAYNAYMALNPNDTEMGTEKADFADVEALETAIGPALWPRGLTEENADAAWEYLTIEDGIGGVETIQPTDAQNSVSKLGQDVTKAFSGWIDALKEYQKTNGLPEYIPLAVTFFEVSYSYTNSGSAVVQSNASMVATAFNAYNALNPNSMIPDSASLEEIKELLVNSDLWPSGLSDADAEAAWEYITVEGGIAMIEEVKKSDPEADTAARENAGKIAEGINITNMFADGPILRPEGAPDMPRSLNGIHAKDLLPMLWYWWPADLTDYGDIEAALDLLDYDGSGSAGVKDNK